MSFPCRRCGAKKASPEGHDPCIARLPGIAQACCGHGEAEGYVLFTDGRVLRGTFEPSAAQVLANLGAKP